MCVRESSGAARQLHGGSRHLLRWTRDQSVCGQHIAQVSTVTDTHTQLSAVVLSSLSMSSSYLTEATATLEYSTYTDSYSLPHSKTVDLGIGEEFIKKDSVSTAPVSPRDETVTSSTQGDLLQTSVISSSTSTSTIKMSSGGSLPPLTYTTTTTIPTIASQASAPEETGVLYCNLDDLSRYIPDNFSFDQIIPEQMGSDDNVSVQVLSLPSSQSQTTSKPMSISFPNADQRLAPAASSVQIQVK